MKKLILATAVSSLVMGMTSASAFAASTTVHGGNIQFLGEVVNAACSVSSDSANQVVQMDQVRTAKLATVGETAGQVEAFNIELKDCDTTVSQNAGVTFTGMTDANEPTALANTAGAGGAQGVALQLLGPDSNKLNMGEESSTIVLQNGTNIIPLGVDYLATSATVTPGLVSATATFNINYN